ncbi:MAG: DUF1566 domain-containing protein [Syntrophobacterales bacterium]|jgi:hypothetical protein
MRKNFFLPLLCLLLLGGCASLKADRKVDGNTFSSSYPKMVIEVSEDYEFLGREKKAIDTQYMHLSGGATATLERFMWRSHSGVLVIEFRKGRGGVPWVDPAQEWTVYPNVQDTGQQKIGKYGYDYCVLQERDGRFMKIFSRNFSGDSLRAHIIYHSSLSTLNFSEFEEDCRNAFRVAGQKLPKTDLHQEFEEESLKMASISEGTAKVSLRTEPKKLVEKDIRKMLARYDFYDDDLNWRGSFANDFVDNGDGTITDRATGLMWQKSGSSGAKTWKRARTYVKQLNEDQFAGYSDWRLPTIDELASLVERETVNEVHIDPIFYDKQNICWSADKGPVHGGATWNPPQVWHVNFSEGSLGLTVLPTFYKGDTSSLTRHYIRAVRSVK